MWALLTTWLHRRHLVYVAELKCAASRAAGAAVLLSPSLPVLPPGAAGDLPHWDVLLSSGSSRSVSNLAHSARLGYLPRWETAPHTSVTVQIPGFTWDACTDG